MTEGDKYVVFNLDGELYGIPIEAVDRIIGNVKVTPVPKAPAMALGLFDLRGESVVAIDLSRRFGRPTPTAGRNHVVVHCRMERFGLRVDGVEGIFPLSASSVTPPPSLVQKGDDPFLVGVAHSRGRLIALLDPDKVVPEGLNLSAANAA
ncbi:MAG: purine-binding chemotaxis protein CheW [Fimbriimonadaceae bacterium]|nr:purine-binding chemotaxis protein CheW [Fimbriimonadaceae bacterium]QYK57669.1 MAG: purine-binding chemotaxis protein CheW [Fimbriimonadaceae bacterium]